MGPDDPAAVAGRGRFRASHADREHVIDTLNVAFADGRLDKDELETRVGQALASRTYADLAGLTADIPARPAQVPPPRPAATSPAEARPPAGQQAVKRGLAATCAVIPPVIFFEAVFRSNNENLAEVFFLLMLLDLIFVTLAAGNTLLNRLEDRRVRGAAAAGAARLGAGSRAAWPDRS